MIYCFLTEGRLVRNQKFWFFNSLAKAGEKWVEIRDSPERNTERVRPTTGIYPIPGFSVKPEMVSYVNVKDFPENIDHTAIRIEFEMIFFAETQEMEHYLESE